MDGYKATGITMTKAMCIGAYVVARTFNSGPGFAIPLFSIDGVFHVQTVLPDDPETVGSFTPITDQQQDSPLIEWLPETERFEVTTGETFLYGFREPSGKLVFKPRQEMQGYLAPFLEDGFGGMPFLTSSVANFVGNAAMIEKWQKACDDLILKEKAAAEEKRACQKII